MVDYNNFAHTFSQSRKNMKWEEISYFLHFLQSHLSPKKYTQKILDIGCWSGRLYWELKKSFLHDNVEWKCISDFYTGIDLSWWLLSEAKNQYNECQKNFIELNMLNLNTFTARSFWTIFFIASYHHLTTFNDRIEVLQKASQLLKTWGRIFMTNWALNSELNSDKYSKNIISGSQNNFWSTDYNIKIWEYSRYYHCFNVKELEYLATESWLKIIENTLFKNQRNYITILEKW